MVKEAFNAAGIVIPEPTYNVCMQERTTPRPRATAGPKKPIDIDRRTELQQEIADDRRTADQADLLRPDAPLPIATDLRLRSFVGELLCDERRVFRVRSILSLMVCG